MTPLALYPSDAALKKSAAMGAFLLFMSYQFWSWGNSDDQLGMYGFLCAGLFVLGQTAYRHLRPKPVFEADAEGFSVKGKAKQSWDSYRGVAIHTARIGIFPAARSLVIKTGKSVLGRKIYINWNQLSGSVREMAEEIDTYANKAKMNAVVIEPYSEFAKTGQAAPVAPKTTAPASPVMRPAGAPVSIETRAQQAATGPVQSQPTLSERIFGRRKVL